MPNDILALVGQFGTWIIFLWLYLAERKRNSDIQDARIAERNAFDERLFELLEKIKNNPPG